MDRPSANDVRDMVAAISTRDYVFIMFTGHCAYSTADRDHILELKKGERIAFCGTNQGRETAKRNS